MRALHGSERDLQVEGEDLRYPPTRISETRLYALSARRRDSTSTAGPYIRRMAPPAFYFAIRPHPERVNRQRLWLTPLSAGPRGTRRRSSGRSVSPRKARRRLARSAERPDPDTLASWRSRSSS